MLCVTRNRFAAGLTSVASERARFGHSEPRVIVAGIQSGSDRRGAEIHFFQLLRRLLDIVRTALDAGGVAAELLAERHRHRILQMRAAHLEDVRERVGLLAEVQRPGRVPRRPGRACPRSSARRVAVGNTSLVDCPMLT